MAGMYCLFCDQRCFVQRKMPVDSKWMAGQVVHLATCTKGKEYDQLHSGYDADTALADW